MSVSSVHNTSMRQAEIWPLYLTLQASHANIGKEPEHRAEHGSDRVPVKVHNVPGVRVRVRVGIRIQGRGLGLTLPSLNGSSSVSFRSRYGSEDPAHSSAWGFLASRCAGTWGSTARSRCTVQ